MKPSGRSLQRAISGLSTQRWFTPFGRSAAPRPAMVWAGDRVRIWSLHPKYLDTRGLTAAWREGLLAQAVLLGRTRGYRQHPQLDRFRRQPSPAGAVAAYLEGVCAEAAGRGYRFDAGRIAEAAAWRPITVTRGQIDHEWAHLASKLRARDPGRAARQQVIVSPATHPLFRVAPGGIEPWERVSPS